MLTHYIEYSLEENAEGVFLLAKLIKGIHSYLTYEEGSQATRQSKLAIALQTKETERRPIIRGIRIMGDKATLNKLKRYPVLIRYLSAQPTPLQLIPETTNWTSWERNRQREREDSSSRQRRHQARGYHPARRPESKDLQPYHRIAMNSDTTGQEFSLTITGTPVPAPAPGYPPLFNAYGLALKNQGATPHF